MVPQPRRIWTAALALGLVAVVAALGLRGGAVSADTTAPVQSQATFTVSGTGSASIAPDEAHVQLGVSAQAATAQQAMANDSTAMQSVVAALEGQGVATADIQTSGLSLGPNYAPGQPDKTPQIQGFQASNNVDVTVRDLTKVGALIDAALAAGANQVGGVSFAASQPQSAYAAAYKAAMADAQAAAQALAQAAGLTLGSVRSVTTNQGGCCVMQYATAARASAASTPVFGGQQSVSVTLQVVYNVGS